MKVPLEWLNEYVEIKKSTKEVAESFTSLGLLLDKPVIDFKSESSDYATKVLDLEHRMDRSDWLSMIGCARDYAAFESTEKKFPELFTGKMEHVPDKLKIEVKVECPEIVHRFNTRVFKGVEVKPSPEWLKNRLEAYGIPSKNNIVDITNYVMVELGQPMHAQDINKLEAPEINIRKAKDGEEITTLLGETLELDENAFVLTQAGKPTVLGGLVGGISTGVDFATKDIVLDAGNYDQVFVRKASRHFKIQNETVLRYDKFLHPRLTQIALDRATKLILEIAGGEVYFNQDYISPVAFEMVQEDLGFGNINWELPVMRIRFSRIEKVGGMVFEPSTVKRILDLLGYEVLEEDSDGFIVEVPYFRTDVIVEDDIVSDVLRIHGYSNIKPVLLDKAPPIDITPEIYKFEQNLRDIMVKLGMYEHITDPLVEAGSSLETGRFVEGNEVDDNFNGEGFYEDADVTGGVTEDAEGTKGTKEANLYGKSIKDIIISNKSNEKFSQIILENALSSEKNSLRVSILETLEPVLRGYSKSKADVLGVFEIGSVYFKNVEVVKSLKDVSEFRRLRAVFPKEGGYNATNSYGSEYLETEIASDKAEGLEVFSNASDITKDIEKTAKKCKKVIAGVFKELGVEYSLKGDMDKAEIFVANEKVGEAVYYSFYLDTLALMNSVVLKRTKLNRIKDARAVVSYEDHTIVVDENVPGGEALAEMEHRMESLGRNVLSTEVVSVYRGKGVEAGKKAMTFRIFFKA